MFSAAWTTVADKMEVGASGISVKLCLAKSAQDDGDAADAGSATATAAAKTSPAMAT
jgi:hypothetical protein